MNDPDISHHYKVLKQFLDISDDSTSRSKTNSSRAARAREKLLKLSSAQFKELSTDVYDELRRRIDESRSEPDFLLPKSSFHPKRNQARQKLSSLPQSRFKDLVSDISYEIERRFLHVPKAASPQNSPTLHSQAHVNHGRSGSETSSSQHQQRSRLSDNYHSSPSQTSPIDSTADHANDKADMSNMSERSLGTMNPAHSTTIQEEIATPDFREVTPQQAIGIQPSNVIPTKASMAWSSDDEEEEAAHDEQPRRLSLSNAFPPRGVSIPTENTVSLNEYDDLKNAHETLLKDYEDLKVQLASLQTQETDAAAIKRMYEVALAKNNELELTLNDLMKDKENYLSNMEDLPSAEEIENLRSANAALRLENQALKNPQPKSTSVSRDLSSSDVHSQPVDVNAELRRFYERLEQLTPASSAKAASSQEQVLRSEVSQWQNKYESLKASKFSESNTRKPLLSDINSFRSHDGLISLDKVSNFFALIDSFFEAIQTKNPDKDLLFEKICTTAIAADRIAQEGSKSLIGNSIQSNQIKEAASHALTATRYYVTHSQLLPKSIVERAVSEIAFSVCDYVSILKINDGSKAPEKSQTASASASASADDEMNVRPLKITRPVKVADDVKVADAEPKVVASEPDQTKPAFFQNKELTSSLSEDVRRKSKEVSDKVKKYETDQTPRYQPEQNIKKQPEHTSKKQPEQSFKKQSEQTKTDEAADKSVSDNNTPTRNKSIFQSLRDRFTTDNSGDKASETPAVNEDKNAKVKEPVEEKSGRENGHVFRDISNASDTVASHKSNTSTDSRSESRPTTEARERSVSNVAESEQAKAPSADSSSLKSTLSSKMSKALSGGLRKASMSSEEKPQKPLESASSGPATEKPVERSNSSTIETGKGLKIKSPSFKVRKVTPQQAQADELSSEEEDEEDEEDEEQDELRQRQDYRKSMAAATFNFDLFDIDDPDNTVTQVLLYLEHQTVQVIATIQDLLSAIKKPDATKGELRENSEAISEVIRQMTEATNTSMNQTRNFQLKEHGSWVVKSLEDCNHRMDALCRPSSAEPDQQEFADRSFKQRLAGISFDIAKCTKELVKTVEEASLKEDIAHLDARLNQGEDLT